MNYDNNGTDGVISGNVQNDKTSVFAVFDGMGGEEKGEMASYIACTKMEEFQYNKKPDTALLTFCKNANNAICKFADENSVTTMGTTAAMVLFDRKKVYICNIGDSKVFKFSQGKLIQLSQDHLALVAKGMKAPLSQNLGIPESEMIISPYVTDLPYSDKDIYLICSDGLTDMVKQEEIGKVLSITKKEYAASVLLKKALENGGRDNTTIITLYLNKESKGLFSLFGK